MSIQLGVVMDPLHSLNTKKDSTLAMLAEAQSRGYRLFYIQNQHLFMRDATPCAQAQVLTLDLEKLHNGSADWFQVGLAETIELETLDVMLMRKDPPFDMRYIYSTYILEQAEQAGVLVVNKPQSLRDANEKFFAVEFPQCLAPMLIASDAGQLNAFISAHKDVIVKPLDGMGGKSIFRIGPNDANRNVILETLTEQGQTPIMAQRYIPEIVDGDKRILLIDGEPIPYALARKPMAGETRANLAQGGSGEGVALSERDRWICEQVGPKLRSMGLVFVGLDVIGDYLTEINVTSPTCIKELDKLYDLNISAVLFDSIEKKRQ